MRQDDARKLDHTTLEEMRIRAVRSVQAGESPEVVARSMRINRRTIYGWLAQYRRGGSITARGHMRFMIKDKGGVNAAVFIEFLKRLMAGAKRAIFAAPPTLPRRPELLSTANTADCGCFFCRPIRPTAIQTNWSGNTSRPTLLAA